MRQVFMCSLIIASLLASGCETLQQASYSGGKIVGEALSVPASAAEGVADGYSGSGSEENPYGR